MKRIPALCLCFLIVLSLCAPVLADGIWYCPVCGKRNDNNYCPADGTRRPDDVSSGGNQTQYASGYAVLNSKLATRTGPGTQYDEPGTFLSSGSQVRVLSRAYDSRNEIWWVQVEFSENGTLYRAYTGAKRFNGLNLNTLPEESVIGSCRVGYSQEGYYGPSYRYARIQRKVPSGVQCRIYGYVYGAGPDDSDFIQIEFYDSALQQTRRAWVPDWAVDDYILYNGF